MTGEEVGTEVDMEALDVPWSVAARVISIATAGPAVAGITVGVDAPGSDPILEVV